MACARTAQARRAIHSRGLLEQSQALLAVVANKKKSPRLSRVSPTSPANAEPGRRISLSCHDRPIGLGGRRLHPRPSSLRRSLGGRRLGDGLSQHQPRGGGGGGRGRRRMPPRGRSSSCLAITDCAGAGFRAAAKRQFTPRTQPSRMVRPGIIQTLCASAVPASLLRDAHSSALSILERRARSARRGVKRGVVSGVRCEG